MNEPLQLVLTVAWLDSLSINCSGQIPSDTNKLTEISVEQAPKLVTAQHQRCHSEFSIICEFRM